MTITPKLAMWINVIFVVAGVVGTGVVHWPHYVPDGVVRDIVETAATASVLFGVINTAMHGYSAPQQGPLVPPTSVSKVL